LGGLSPVSVREGARQYCISSPAKRSALSHSTRRAASWVESDGAGGLGGPKLWRAKRQKEGIQIIERRGIPSGTGDLEAISPKKQKEEIEPDAHCEGFPEGERNLIKRGGRGKKGEAQVAGDPFQRPALFTVPLPPIREIGGLSFFKKEGGGQEDHRRPRPTERQGGDATKLETGSASWISIVNSNLLPRKTPARKQGRKGGVAVPP